MRPLAFYQEKLKDFSELSLAQGIKQLTRLYSCGYSLEAMQRAYRDMMVHFSKQENNTQSIDNYQLALHLVSLSYLLDDHKYKGILQQAITSTLQEDSIISFLLYPEKGLDTTRFIQQPIPYQFLNEAILNQTKRADLINTFLKNYYAGLQSNEWHDSHLKEEQGFFGYWSFELAAVVKILNINDHSFAGHMFYPRDLTNQLLLPTWEDSTTGQAARAAIEHLTKTATKTALSQDIEKKTEALIEAVKALYQFNKKDGDAPEMPYAFAFGEVFKSLNKAIHRPKEQKTVIQDILSSKQSPVNHELKETLKKAGLENAEEEMQGINEKLSTLFQSQSFGQTIDKFIADLQAHPEQKEKVVADNFQNVLKNVQEEVMDMKSETEEERKKKYKSAAQQAIDAALKARGIRAIRRSKDKNEG